MVTVSRSSLPLCPPVALVLLIAGCYSPPSDNALVGRREAAVLAQLGPPSREWAAHYGNPPDTYTAKFTGEIRSAVFKKRGGEVYVTFEKRGGVWYAISNAWLREGWDF